MKKKMYIIVIVISTLMLSACTKYEELNNLAIISNITINYKDKNYVVTMQEIIPQKSENKVDYDYKYRTGSDESLTKAFSNIIDHSPKKIYLRRVQNIIVDYKHKDKVIEEFLKYDLKRNNINREASLVVTKNSLDKFLKINSDYKYIDSVLKNKKKILFKVSNLYKKKRSIKLPMLKINNKEIIFHKYVYLHV